VRTNRREVRHSALWSVHDIVAGCFTLRHVREATNKPATDLQVCHPCRVLPWFRSSQRPAGLGAERAPDAGDGDAGAGDGSQGPGVRAVAMTEAHCDCTGSPPWPAMIRSHGGEPNCDSLYRECYAIVFEPTEIVM
jgi:hypothetical protein